MDIPIDSCVAVPLQVEDITVQRLVAVSELMSNIQELRQSVVTLEKRVEKTESAIDAGTF